MSHIRKESTDNTSIEWVVALARARGMRAAVWNPIEGCSPAGEGCRNCWAASEVSVRGRQGGQGGTARPGNSPQIRAASSKIGERFGGLTRKAGDGRAVFNGVVREIEADLDKPLRTRHPTVFFVCSRSDLFAGGVSDALRHRIYAVMAMCPQHLFLVLTKRPEGMAAYYGDANEGGKLGAAEVLSAWCTDELGRMEDIRKPSRRYIGLYRAMDRIVGRPAMGQGQMSTRGPWTKAEWPLANLWLGVSVWDQASADEYLPVLARVPAALRFVSIEPLLGGIDLVPHLPGLDWVLVGGESGRGARPCHPDWVRDLRDPCRAAGVRFFFKQWGEWAPFVGDNESDGARLPSGEWIGFDEDHEDRHLPSQHTWSTRWSDPVTTFTASLRVGKKRAGRMLDGYEWLEVPAMNGSRESRFLAGCGAAPTKES